jgi:hypothetical protein
LILPFAFGCADADKPSRHEKRDVTPPPIRRNIRVLVRQPTRFKSFHTLHLSGIYRYEVSQ